MLLGRVMPACIFWVIFNLSCNWFGTAELILMKRTFNCGNTMIYSTLFFPQLPHIRDENPKNSH